MKNLSPLVVLFFLLGHAQAADAPGLIQQVETLSRELEQLKKQLPVIETGAGGATADTPPLGSWHLNTGNGDRVFDIPVQFKPSFSGPPHVLLGITYLDAGTTKIVVIPARPVTGPLEHTESVPCNVRVQVDPLDITNSGFTVRIKTRADSVIWGVYYNWLAFE